MKIPLHHNLWSADRTLILELPDRWNTEILQMKGDGARILGGEDYRKALVPLEQQAKGRKEICVLFDDLSRPTRASLVLPHLFELFEKCGIRDEQVRFICALGTHGPHDNVAFRKKLGTETLERFPVYNHNPYENCEYLGKTKLGTPVLINREYRACDLKIGIGSLLPHSFCGVGGGYKIVFPGVAHTESVVHHHQLLNQYRHCYVMGKHRGNELLEDVKEFGRAAGLDFKIDLLVNTGAEAAGIYAGEPEGIYESFAQEAILHYSSEAPGKADIVIVNTYGKASEGVIALTLAEELLKESGGDIVVLCDVPEGQVVHYTLGRFGNNQWGSLAFGERNRLPKTRRIFLFSRFKDLAGSFWFGKREEIFWYNDLSDIITLLDEEYSGKPVDACVIPDGTIQITSPAR
jgi:nickel-dependent lactate racemase